MLWLIADSQASRARIALLAAVPVTKVHRTENDDGDCGLLRAEFSAYGYIGLSRGLVRVEKNDSGLIKLLGLSLIHI